MPGLKDYLDTDLDVFMSTNEFAEVHNIDGVDLPVIIDEDILKIRSEDKSEQYEGLYSSRIAIFVRVTDLPERPVFGQQIRIDGDLYTVIKCNEGMGIYEIELEANES